MRRLVVLLFAAVSAPAYCQISGDMLIQNAMQALSTNPSIYLQLTGTDDVAGLRTGYTYSTYIQVSQIGGRVYDQVNCTEYAGSGIYAKPIMSLIGDGVTLWRYDYVNNTYSAVNYGTYSGNQPADYTGALFRYLTSMSQEYMSYPIMLLRQIYSVDGARYQSWLPGVTPLTDSAGNVIYSVGVPPRRTITFTMGTGALTDVAFDDVTTLRGVQKNTDWAIHIIGGLTINSSLFSFTPPKGARPIAGPKMPVQN
ncbi:MAG: hypothetical protein ACYC96_07215 [Fimbriimonadaceae bacterium]